MRTQRTLQSAGVVARLAPVPRYLSASCGTCVFYTAEESNLERMDRDVERVVCLCSGKEAMQELLYRA